MKRLPGIVCSMMVAVCATMAAGAPSQPVEPVRVMVEPTIGDPGLRSISAIAFAPDGVLILSDITGSKIVVVQTEDINPLPGKGLKIENLTGEIAARLGGSAEDVEIIDFAVNPASQRAYLVIKKHGSPGNLIVTIDPSGKIAQLPLANVPHVTVDLPAAEDGSIPRLSTIAWAGDRLVASARTGEEFGSKLIVIPAPLGPQAAAAMYSAETYHISHRRWETKAPMQALFPLEENGTRYIIGGFGCTPIVKYPLDAVEPGAKVKGISMIELGSGNRPLSMFAYRKNGRDSVIVNTFRFHHERRPFGPSPYWTCRFDQSLLAAEKVNEEGFRRPVNEPDHPTIHMVSDYNGVVHMARFDDSHALVVRSGDDQRMSLEVLELP